MNRKSLLNYKENSLQRETCLEFINTLERILGVDISGKGSLEKLSTECLLDFSIFTFDYFLCDEMRVHAGVLPLWTDSSAGYYRSDSQKMELLKNLLQKNGIEIGEEYTYLGPRVHIQEYQRIYGGTVVEFSPQFSVLITGDKKPEPILGTPRQEVFSELLQCGINPLDLYSSNTRKMNMNMKISAKEIWLSAGQDDVDEKTKSLRKYYEKTLQEDVKIIPFASGTSANECIVQTLGEAVGVKGVYMHPYWYYENVPTIKRIFRNKVKTKFPDANVFFLNLEPTNSLNLDYEREIISPADLIAGVIKLAVSNPENKYYMVIDNTVNPFAIKNTLKKFLELKNGVLITTASISKHQNGNRKYFFGIMTLYGQACKLVETVRETQDIVNGVLSKYQARAFPILICSDMKKRIHHVKNLNKVFFKSFGSKKYFSENYTFNSLIFPRYSPYEYKGIGYREFNYTLEKSVKDIVLSYKDVNFEYGDSFGLSKTRIIVQGDDFDFHLPRVSPGFNCKEFDMEKFAKYFQRELSKFDYKFDVKS